MDCGFVFIAGPPRSGTTLLSLVISSHPYISIAPENRFLPALIRRCGSRQKLNDKDLAWLKKTVASDDKLSSLKSPLPDFMETLKFYSGNVTVERVFSDFLISYALSEDCDPAWVGHKKNYLDMWEKLKTALPESRLITIFRDCRDTSFSAAQNLPGQSLARAARIWAARAKEADKFKSAFPHDCLELKYEKFVSDPESQCRLICDFLSVDYSEQMLFHHEDNRGLDRVLRGQENKHFRTKQPVNAKRVERWRKEMRCRDVALVEAICARQMQKRGYNPEIMTATTFPSGCLLKWRAALQGGFGLIYSGIKRIKRLFYETKH